MEINKIHSKKVVKLQNTKAKCPSCNKKPIEPFMPFCSKKCSDLDLMKWLSDENYINLE